MTQSQLLMSQSLTESMIQEIKEVTNSAESSNNSKEIKPQQEESTTLTTMANATPTADNGGSGDAHSQYEISVTEKENLLISSFNKNFNLNNGSNSDQQQPETLVHDQDIGDGLHHNGKNGSEAVDIGMKTTELIIQDAINQQNGHKNGGFDDVL